MIACVEYDWRRLSRFVRERRAELGISQDEVAARGGPSSVTLTKIELDRWNPSPTRAQKTLALLDKGLSWDDGGARAAAKGGEPTARSGAADATNPAVKDAAVEAEVLAMQQLAKLLEPLESSSRRRALRWAWDRYSGPGDVLPPSSEHADSQ